MSLNSNFQGRVCFGEDRSVVIGRDSSIRSKSHESLAERSRSPGCCFRHWIRRGPLCGYSGAGRLRRKLRLPASAGHGTEVHRPVLHRSRAIRIHPPDQKRQGLDFASPLQRSSRRRRQRSPQSRDHGRPQIHGLHWRQSVRQEKERKWSAEPAALAASPCPFHLPYRECRTASRLVSAVCNWRTTTFASCSASPNAPPFVRDSRRLKTFAVILERKHSD